MKEITPNYYHKFKCIADRCKHSCCIGWEIEIDAQSMERYQAMDTPLGERILKNIEGDPPHFILGQGERCPFLTEKGLCDIICECGEDGLCDICTLHPRFRNFYGDFCETGLGLCCEEAARLILTEEEPFSVLVPQEGLTEEEQVFFGIRERIFEILQNRQIGIYERFQQLAEGMEISLSVSVEELCENYLSLERLDENWTEILRNLKGYSFDGSIFQESVAQIPMEQLAVYFIFRHLSDALWDGNYQGRVRFALMSCLLLGILWEKDKKVNGIIDFETWIDLVRMYSAEVEYSEDNLETLLGDQNI